MPRSRGSSVTSDEYATCYGAICSFIGCLLCFGKMKPSSRIALTWFWLFVISAIGASLVSKVYFKSTSVTMHPTDMRILYSTSTEWCTSIEVTSGRPIDIYRRTKKPDLLTAVSQRKNFEFDWRNYVAAYEDEHWEFYLLKKSVVSMYIQDLCIGDDGNHGHVYVLKGDANFSKWRNQPSCSDCWSQHTFIKGCRNNLIQFHVEENDQYYFVVYNANSRKSIKFNLRFHLQRTIYDVSTENMFCDQETNCIVSVEPSNNLVATYSVTRHSAASDETSVKVKCEPRYFLFIPIFVLIPLCLGLVITWLIVTKARNRSSRQHRRSSDVFTISGGDPSASGIVSPVFVMAPPSYEECTENPPSYDDVLRQKHLNSEA